MQSIDGILSRVLHHAPSRFSPAGEMFLIARLHNGLTIKGEMAKPHEGENYRFWGEYRDSKPPYTGQAFEFQAWEPVIEKSESGITSYLASYVDGLGKVKSAALVAAFGSETLDILRTDPTKAISVPGITAALVERIKDHFENDLSIDPVAYARLVEMFSEHRVPKRIILTLLKSFGSNAPDRVIDNPYLLLDLPRMGWETVDAIAVQTIGYPKDGPARHAAATIEGLTRHCLDGHTVAEEPEIIELAFGLMGTTPNEAGWDLCKSQGRIIEEPADSKTVTPRRFALPPIWEAEQTVASRLMSLAGTAKPLECEIPTDGLQGEQIAAVEVIKASGVTILAGAPGTGKTYVTAHVIKALLAAGMGGIRVGCPTGKAAKRAAELLAAAGIPEGRVPCTTIHRMLAPQPSEAPPGIPGDDAKVKRGRDEFSFGHGPDNPLSVDYLVIDETSMVDVKLAASVLDAVPLGTRILFVGDQNQLPSVGPGSVLRDIMETLPTVYLTEIRRSRPGRVIQACHDIIKGKTPTPADRVDIESGENWVHLEIDKPHDIAAQIVELHQAGKRFTDLLWDFQVVTPQKQRLPVACDNLNQLLSAKLNPIPAEEQNGSANLFGGAAGATADSQESRTPPFRKGDKVVRTKNGLCDQLIPLRPKVTPTTDADGFDWVAGIQNTIDPEEEYRADWGWNGRKFSIKETMIVNGDMGQVLDILRDPVKREVYVVVKFRDPDRLCRLPYGKCELIAAYAMTCHKAQGSGFPYVIVPAHDSFYWDARQNKGIFNREWIYTAMSRAEQLLVTVGQFSAIEAAVKRKTVHRRKTRLAGLLSAQQATQSDTEGTDNG